MPKPTYVIEDGNSNLWDGALWTKEYPDAEVFQSKSVARRAANMLSKKLDETVWIIKDYGLDTEETTKIVCY
jgi:hypothetical protein